MIRVNHYIYGIPVNPPINRDSFEVEINPEPIGNDLSVAVRELQWAEAEAQLIRGLLEEGMTGGIGVSEGVPHTIEVVDENLNRKFEHLISLGDGKYDKHLVTVDSFPLHGGDWMNMSFDSVTYEYLYAVGKITDADFIYVPYVISTVPNYRDAFLVTLTIATVVLEVKNTISNISSTTTESVTFIDSIGGILRLIAIIIWCAILVATIIKLIIDLINLIIQRVKYITAMDANTLFIKGCEALGLKWGGIQGLDPLEVHQVIIPESNDVPENPGDEFRMRGFFSIFAAKQAKSTGYYRDTFGQFIRDMQTRYYSVAVIRNATLYLVPDNGVPLNATFQIADLDQHEFTTNYSELAANVNISFRTDSADNNTKQNWLGTNCDISTRPIKIGNRSRLIQRNGIQIELPFARGIRKNSLTTPEKLAQQLVDTLTILFEPARASQNLFIMSINIGFIVPIVGFLDAIEFVTSIDIKRPNFIPLIQPFDEQLAKKGVEDFNSRIGMLLLENDFISVPKMVLIQRGSSAKNNKVMLEDLQINRARFVWEKYYKNYNRQFRLRPFHSVEMNEFDILSVAAEKAMKLQDGRVARVESCNWNADSRIATMKVKDPLPYTANLKQHIYEPLGR